MSMIRGAQKLVLSDGVHLAYQEWGTQHAKRVLALHGWLDNSNSFSYLGPYLADRGYHCVAIDHIGHGLSDHLGTGANYSITKSTSCVADFVHSIGWNQRPFHLMGHSMGASISMMYAAAMHDHIDKLVLIEGFGPITESAEDAPRNLRKAIDAERSMRAKAKQSTKHYATLSEAVQARIRAVSFYPGQQFLSRGAAKLLVSRGTALATEETADGSEYKDLEEETVGPVRFRHDKRLVLPSYLYHTDEQVLAYVRSIQAQTLLLTAKHGWPVSSATFQQRKQIMQEKDVLRHELLEGSHHLHMDPEHREPAAAAIATFLDASLPYRMEI